MRTEPIEVPCFAPRWMQETIPDITGLEQIGPGGTCLTSMRITSSCIAWVQGFVEGSG